jgi:hypothetical protein
MAQSNVGAGKPEVAVVGGGRLVYGWLVNWPWLV